MQDDQTPNTPGQKNPEDYKPAPDTQPSFGDPNPQTTPVTEQNPPQPAPESTTTEQTATHTEETTPAVEKPRKEGGFLSFALTLVAAFVLVQFINMFVFQSYKVVGSSMYPTLSNGDRLIISKIARTSSKITKNTFEPDRGEIIVFVDPIQPDLQLIKRVIGLPGERVVVANQKITVYNSEHPNGFNPDDAEYGKVLPPTSGNTDITVPKGHLFVSGDNREGSNSLDSRNELGTVPEGNIIGTLVVRVFPFDSAKFF